MDRQDIIRLLTALELPSYQYWVAAGAGLVMHGVRESTGDLDVGCTSEVIDRLFQEGFSITELPGGKRAARKNGIYEFFEDWAVDEIKVIEGICVASLADIRKQKQMLGREKDIRDVGLIDAFLEKQNKLHV